MTTTRTLNTSLFIGLPLYELGRARGAGERRLTEEEQNAVLAGWLTGRPVGERCAHCGHDSAPEPRCMATIRAIAAHLGGTWDPAKSLPPRFRMPVKLGVSPCATFLSLARSEVAHDFLQSGAAHWLSIDSDMGYLPSVVEDLLEADGDVVFASYATRREPFTIMLRTIDGQDPREAPRRTIGSGARVIEAEGGGMGCALISRRVVEDLWEHPDPELVYYHTHDDSRRVALFKEYIAPYVHSTLPRFFGEDLAFMARARARGFKVECLVDAVIDHDGVVCSLRDFFDSDEPLREIPLATPAAEASTPAAPPAAGRSSEAPRDGAL